jgi:hypothetical protein
MESIKTWQERLPECKGYFSQTERAMELEIADLRAALVKASTVPGGWKLVPVEPTDAMLAEVDEEVGGSCYSCSKWNASHDDCRRVYAAMLSAAPTPGENP